MATEIVLDRQPSPADVPVEVVERKGLGHPDTLADALSERMSVAYSRFCPKGAEAAFGKNPAYNAGKVYSLHAESFYGVSKAAGMAGSAGEAVRMELAARPGNGRPGASVIRGLDGRGLPRDAPELPSTADDHQRQHPLNPKQMRALNREQRTGTCS